MKTKTMKRFRHARLEIEDLLECMRESDGMSYADYPEWPDFDERLLRE